MSDLLPPSPPPDGPAPSGGRVLRFLPGGEKGSLLEQGAADGTMEASTLLAHLAAPTVVIDRDGRISEISPAAARMLEATVPDLRGRPSDDHLAVFDAAGAPFSARELVRLAPQPVDVVIGDQRLAADLQVAPADDGEGALAILAIDPPSVRDQSSDLRCRLADAVLDGAGEFALSQIATDEIESLLPGETVLLARRRGREPVLAVGGTTTATETSSTPWHGADDGDGPSLSSLITGAPASRNPLKLSLPIETDDGRWGTVLVFGDPQKTISRHQEDQVRAAAELVGRGIDAAHKQERLHALAHADPLTGLANRRAFEEEIAREMERIARYDGQCALIMIDIDFFKRVNDLHGHPAGDDALRTLAATLERRARATDVVSRIGGEEFAWLMPETGGRSALQAADAFRQAIEGMTIGRVGPITISAGVCHSSEASTTDTIMAKADNALYWAKATGRNQAILYSPAEHEGQRETQLPSSRAQTNLAIGSVLALARAVDARDRSTREHSQRVAQLSVALAGELGWPARQQRLLYEAALLHDVGKIGVPDEILLHAGPLSAREYERVKQHSEIGAEIVAGVLTPEQTAWVRGHHERPDGRGYPDHLSAGETPMGCSIIAVADAWDTMTAGRSYKESLSEKDALGDCQRCAGSQFDERVVAALSGLVARGQLNDLSEAFQTPGL